MSINIVNIVIFFLFWAFFLKTFILSQDFVSNIMMMDRRTSPFKIYVLARLIV